MHTVERLQLLGILSLRLQIFRDGRDILHCSKEVGHVSCWMPWKTLLPCVSVPVDAILSLCKKEFDLQNMYS